MPHIARSRIVTPSTLSADDRKKLIDGLYEVHRQIFDGVEREAFARYVVESKAEHSSIHVHENEAGEIVGYMALHIFEKQLGGVKTAVFRAEAGSLREYRGTNANNGFFFKVVLPYLAAHRDRRAYYLGCLVHPSSYSLFSAHLDEVWPRRQSETPPDVVAFMCELAAEFGLEVVDPSKPLVRDVGWRTRETDTEREYWLHCDRPDARYYVELNPGYVRGHGVLTLAPLTAGNLAGALRSLGLKKLRRPLETAMALAQRTALGARLLRAHILEQLRASPLFSQCSDATLLSLAERSDIVPLQGGRYIFHEGDTSDEMYLLSSGAAYVLLDQGGKEKVIDELSSGALFGEIAMLAGERRSASIRAATASMLLRIPRAVVMDLIEKDATLKHCVWRTFAERRFDDLVRGLDRYRHLNRRARLAWVDNGRHRELTAGETLTLDAGSQLFMVSGLLDIDIGGARIAARGSMLLEITRQQRARVQEPSRIVLLTARPAAMELIDA